MVITSYLCFSNSTYPSFPAIYPSKEEKKSFDQVVLGTIMVVKIGFNSNQKEGLQDWIEMVRIYGI